MGTSSLLKTDSLRNFHLYRFRVYQFDERSHEPLPSIHQEEGVSHSDRYFEIVFNSVSPVRPSSPGFPASPEGPRSPKSPPLQKPSPSPPCPPSPPRPPGPPGP